MLVNYQGNNRCKAFEGELNSNMMRVWGTGCEENGNVNDIKHGNHFL